MLKNYLINLWTGSTLVKTMANKLRSNGFSIDIEGVEHVLVWVPAEDALQSRIIAAMNSYGYVERIEVPWVCRVLKTESVVDAA